MSRRSLSGALGLALFMGCTAGCTPPKAETACEGKGAVLHPHRIAPISIPPDAFNRDLSSWLRVEFSPHGQHVLFLEAPTGTGSLWSTELGREAPRLLLPEVALTDLIQFTEDGRVALVATANPDVPDTQWLRAIRLEDGRVVTLTRTMIPVPDTRNPDQRLPRLSPFVPHPQGGAVVASERQADGSVNLVSLSVKDGGRTVLVPGGRFFGHPYDATTRVERVFYTDGARVSEWAFAEGASHPLLDCDATCPDLAMTADGHQALAARTSPSGVHSLYHLPPANQGQAVHLGDMANGHAFFLAATRFAPNARWALVYEEFKPVPSGCAPYHSLMFGVDLTAPLLQPLSSEADFVSSEVEFTSDSARALVPLFRFPNFGCLISGWPYFRLFLMASDFTSAEISLPSKEPPPYELGYAYGPRGFTPDRRWALWDDNLYWYRGPHVRNEIGHKDLYALRLDATGQQRVSIGQNVQAWATLGDSRLVLTKKEGTFGIQDLETNSTEAFACAVQPTSRLSSSPDKKHVLVVSPPDKKTPEDKPAVTYVVSEGALARLDGPSWTSAASWEVGFSRWVDSHRLVILGQEGLFAVEVP